MELSFLFQESEFMAFSKEHWIPLCIVAVIGLFSIIFAKYSLNDRQQVTFGTLLALIPVLGVFGRLTFLHLDGILVIKDELPLHICRFVALVIPLAMWKKNRYWLGVFYFWILVGTLNANLTPDIENGFPHWSYFTYWILHSFLVILPFYCIFIFRIEITWKDLLNAFIFANVFMVVTLVVNFLMDTNYMYTRQKPPSASLIDYMGPWPWYLVSLQFLALFLFFLVYIPFYLRRVLRKVPASA